MKAVVVTSFGESDVLEVQELETPRPGPGQIAVRVKYASLNFADILSRKGHYHGGFAPPFVPGLDVFGEVCGVGPGVDTTWIGRRVLGFPTGGSHQEIAICEPNMLIEAPLSVSEDQLAASPLVLATALELIARSGDDVAGASTVVYSATGGLGGTLVQLLQHFGASQIIALVGAQNKAQRATALGAHAAVVYRDGTDYANEVLGLTSGRGVDIIFNSVAGETSSSDMRMLADFGRVMVFGMGSSLPATYLSNDLHPRSRSVVGFSFGTMRRTRPELVQGVLQRCYKILEEGNCTFPIGGIYPPQQAKEAHEMLESGRSQGKILLNFA